MHNLKRQTQVDIQCGHNEVKTAQGILRGVKTEGIYAFRGIEYAQAARFQAPKAVEPWCGVKEAITYGNACPEIRTELPSFYYREHPFYTVQSEDCLYLNVFTENPEAKAPVVVRFMDQDYNHACGVESMTHQDLDDIKLLHYVLVTVNTRLNVLGYLDLSRFGEAYAHSGNAGLMDREAALNWIKENIAVFGGDPEKIKIVLSEKADPAITIERTKDTAEKMTDYVLKDLGVSTPAQLETIWYDRLAEAAEKAVAKVSADGGTPIAFGPVQDEVYCPGHPVVQTAEGALRGAKEDEVYIFRGVQYAEAQRFHLPTPVQPWNGIKNALVYGAVCPEVQTVQPDDNFNVPHVFYPQNETCQYLNIWTKSLDPAAKRPVLVWFHGGGFATGSGIEHFAYNGKDMADYGDVVVVTINHRLNVLGYLDLSDFGEEYRYSGNAGNADLVESLRYVKRNIAAFGGDPANVTIFGQSGGGGKVASLLQTPSADGLFHRAVIQSGLADFGSRRKKALHDETAKLLLEKLGIAPENVKELETIPYYELQQALLAMDPRAPFNFGPHRDDDFYLGDAMEVGICEHAKSIPVMVGNVLGEFSQNFIFTAGKPKNSLTAEELDAILAQQFGELKEEAAQLQKEAYPNLCPANILFTDTAFRPSTYDYLRLRAENGCENTYGYMFAMEQPIYEGTLPWHNAEIPYVFHNASCIEPSYAAEITEKVEDEVSMAWIRFAQTGAPGWHAYTTQAHSMMFFDVESQEKNGDAEEKLVRFLKAHPVQLERITRQKKPILFGGGPRF